VDPFRRGGTAQPLPAGFDWDSFVGPFPWVPYQGGRSSLWGDINWGQHHYDIVQWGNGADDTGPVEINGEDGQLVFRYANGVEVFGCPPPGGVWKQGGACFVGTDDRITVHRDELSADPRVVRSAALCLSKIATEEARRLLSDAYARATGPQRDVVGDGLIRCADELLKPGKTADAAAIYAPLAEASQPSAVRKSALRGVVRSAGEKSVQTVREFLASEDSLVRSAGAHRLPALSDADLKAVAADVGRFRHLNG